MALPPPPTQASSGVSLFVALMLLAFGVVAAAEGPTYKLGRPATEEELGQPAAAIRPDGDGLPPGSGTPAPGRDDVGGTGQVVEMRPDAPP